MIASTAIALCAIELAAHYVFTLSTLDYAIVGQVELMLLAAIGLLSDGGRRDRSILTIFVMWFGWIALTDWAPGLVSDLVVQYETVVFSMLVMWAITRPYFFTSDARSDSTVCIMFYRGTKAPFLSTLSSILGLPFSSVAIVAGDKVLRASGSGKMVLTDARALDGGDFIRIDTGIPVSDAIASAMYKCEGKPTRAYGLFRSRCVANLSQVLKEIGYEPKSAFHKIPSIFYFQCVKQAHE